MKILSAILVILTLPAMADNITEEQVKQAQQQCQFKAVIAESTQQTRINYKKETGEYQSWETFFHFVVDKMNLKHDDGLKAALDISKHVFYDYATETKPEDVLGYEFDKCWQEFVNANSGVEM